MAVKEKIKTLLEQLNTGIIEKEEVMALALLSSIAGESIFLLGPPGVAKSLIARRLKYAYKDAKVFEYLMSRFSTPDEIFGPVSISGLQNDKYERIIENYLPSAEVVFLDEIWKAGPSIQNALLTILNEKKFRGAKNDEGENGESKIEIDVPIKALISASNELPAKDQGLEALWDRFLVRLFVGGIGNKEKFNDMVKMPSASLKINEENIDGQIIDKEYKDWSEKIDQIVIPENVLNVIDVIRKKIEAQKEQEEEKKKPIWYVSDRRWRKIVRLLRTSAFVNDRTEVDLMDCFLIKHCIWNEESQMQTVSVFVNEAIRDYGPDLDMDLRTEREEFEKMKPEIVEKTSEEGKYKLVKKSNPNGDKFYRLTRNFSDHYSLIKVDSVDNASDSYENAEIFTDDFSENIDCYIKEGNEKHNILLHEEYYGDYQKYQLETVLTMSKGDFEFWEKETQKLLDVLNEKKTETNRYWETFSESFYGNIFVGKNNADEHIKSNLDAVVMEIDKFTIEINEIRNNYQKIYKSNESQI